MHTARINPWNEEFRVRFTRCDPDGKLSADALADMLQEAANSHAEHLGFSLQDMRKKGVTWVMLRMRIEIDVWPCIHDAVRVETWPSSLDRLYAHRDFKVFDASGREIARATTAWVLIDAVKRTPVRIAAFLSELYSGLYGASEAPKSMDHTHVKLAAPADESPALPVIVRKTDTDMNGHVNNAAYVALLSEALPADAAAGMSLREFSVEFKEEAFAQDRLESRGETVETAEGLSVDLGLFRTQENKPVALARMKWVKQG